jgi:hypothetical protein
MFRYLRELLTDWGPYFLPALSNLILVLLGVVLSLPSLAERIEETPKYRRALAIVCLISGVVGFAFDVLQRHSGDRQTRQLVNDVSTLVGNTNALAGNTNALAESTTQAVNEIAGLRNQVTAYERSSEIARKQGNQQLAGAFERQAKTAQEAADILTKQQISDYETFQAARLVIENLRVGGADDAEASFVLVNRGNSIASEVVEESFGAQEPERPEPAPGARGRQNVDINEIKAKVSAANHPKPYQDGFTLGKGGQRTFTFSVPAKGQRWWWRNYEFAYLDIFGHEHSVSACWVHGYGRVQPAIPCPLRP